MLAYFKNKLAAAVVVCLSVPNLGGAQTLLFSQDALELSGRIVIPTCTSFLQSNGFVNALVFNLPSLNTTALLNGSFGPITPIELKLNTPKAQSNCISGFNLPITLVFDTDLAAVAPRTGLLRNTASFRPAQNVMVQLGLIDNQGVFSPLDLNQPQVLNEVLAQQGSAAEAANNLTLGVRYVTSQSALAQNTAANPGSQDVTAGNISVFLPFLLKLN
jgi:type 1 fimbria pilin